MKKTMCGEPTEDGFYIIGKCTACGYAELADPAWQHTPLLEHCGECPRCFEEDRSVTIHKLMPVEEKQKTIEKTTAEKPAELVGELEKARTGFKIIRQALIVSGYKPRDPIWEYVDRVQTVLSETTPSLVVALEDVREWVASGTVRGVHYDEMSVCDQIDSVLTQVKGITKGEHNG